MPIPKPREKENKDDFINRCMSNDTMKKEYPDNKQRLAVCQVSWRDNKMSMNLDLERFKKKSNEKLEFKEHLEFNEGPEKGTFEGILVKYENKRLAHGIFRFAKDSLKINNGKSLFILYQHMGSQVPVGTMVGESDSEGFKIKAKLDLSLLENGIPVNSAAHALYSLMKTMGAKFDLSVGGYITVREIVDKDNERFVNIKEFDAYEGSIVMRGAVEGSKVTNVFGNEGGNENMNEELLKMLATFSDQIKALEQQMFKANEEKQFEELKSDFSKLTSEIEEVKAKLGNEEAFGQINAKIEALDGVIKTLKQSYKEDHPEEYNEMQELYQLFSEAKATNRAIEFSEGEEIKFGATEAGLPDAIKPTYVNKIIERLQAANPILSDVSFQNITDASMKLTREELGLPTVGIVGGDEVRYETTTPDLGPVTIALFQFYVMPTFQNRLSATNYVGFVAFAIMRAEYAMSLLVADKLLNGSGTNEPLGILNDSSVTLTKEFDLTASTGAELDDAVFAKKLKSMFYAVRGEVAGNGKWYMRRGTWEYITGLQDSQGRFYFQDLLTNAPMSIKTRPVVIIESDESGLVDINTASNGDNIFLFGDVKNGVRAITNNKMSISIKDQITTKGYTKYWMEKGLGFAVQLPEYFVIGTLKK